MVPINFVDHKVRCNALCQNSNADCSVYSGQDFAQDEIISNLVLPVLLRTSFPHPDFHRLTLLIRTTHHERVWNWTFSSIITLYFYFFDNQQININIKIINFFHLNAQTYVFIYLNRRIVKYKNVNFKILIFRQLIPLVHSFLTHSSISNFSEVLWSNWLKYWGLQ